MNIAIDGYEANAIQRVGIGEYASQILIHMHALLAKRLNNKTSVTVYLPEPPQKFLPHPSFYWRYVVRSPKKLWTYGALPWAIATSHPRPDVVFSPTHYIPRYRVSPQVMSIMDLSYLYYPELFRTKDLHQLIHWTKYAATKSVHIFTISQFSKNDILKQYNKKPDQVSVTYPGLRMSTQQTPITLKELEKKYALPERFILSVGTVQPRKNYERLIEGFARAIKIQPQLFENINLVIVGKKGWLYEPILDAPQKFEIADRVKFLDFVSDEELAVLYQHALFFVLVSLYEGFGLPVLEAMSIGCPVLVSNVSSLPEIAGDAGYYVDPLNIEDIVHGLTVTLKESGSETEKKRIEKGKKKSLEFTWEKAAMQTLDILEKIGRKDI